MRLLEALLLAMLMLLCRGAEGAGAATAAQSNETKAAAGSEETTGTSSAPLPGQSDLPAQTPDASETVITGWVHDRASVSRPADDVAGDVDLRVPHDLLVNTATFYVQLSHRRDRRTAFVASGVLSHRQRLRDAQRPIRPSGRGNYDLDTDLLEAYVGLYRGVVDVTLGQQRIPWGRNELFGINDVINARDLRDPLLVPEELRYRPTPAARVDVRLQDVSLQLAWMPFLVPHRFEFYGTNWAVVQDDAPPALRAVLNQAADSRQAGSLFALGESPEDLSHSQLAARLAWNWRDSEVNTYYRYGPDPTPLWSYDQKLLRQLLDPALGTAAAAQTVAFAAFADSVRTSYKRGHHLGMSVVAPVGAFVLYAEGAYETARAFITADRESLARPMTAVVVGVAYERGLTEAVDLAFEYLRVHELPRTESLLWFERDNLSSALSLRWGLGSNFSLQARGIASLAPRSVSGRLGVSFSSNRLSLGGGLQMLAGSDHSFGGSFRANTGLYLDLRYLL